VFQENQPRLPSSTNTCDFKQRTNNASHTAYKSISRSYSPCDMGAPRYSPSATAPSTMITKLPCELVLPIFEKMSIGNAICLGLTCRHFYVYFKTYHPGLVSLDYRICTSACNCQRNDKASETRQQCLIRLPSSDFFLDYTCQNVLVTSLLQEGIMKGYRMCFEIAQPRMMNEEVYGQWGHPRLEQCRFNERRLIDRYSDWSDARF
jgi:hypothetical protein